jgi:tetratricopeptide (TPR) repeat protein
MKRISILFLSQMLFLSGFAQQPSTIRESLQTFRTYPYSDPNPIANPVNSYYPYFRFDGFAIEAVNKQWKVIEMENDYIRLSIFPEIGGKIWGAIDKTNGNDFIYYNHVVKFRDIAMRGAWTSGGIEINFGIFGHAPTCATPVDYIIRTNEDGSASCFLSAIDLITGTKWSVEVNLPKDKAYFTTSTTWYNPSVIPTPYYHWMNAAYHTGEDLQFIFPGQSAIGHGGEVVIEKLPYDTAERNILWYKNNAYGDSKSLHVVGQFSDFYAAYWHNKEAGSVHYSPFDEKLGMKIWLWSFARNGGIWEDLLTDSDGQYVELQSGRMHSQAALSSGETPFKLTNFPPLSTDTWTEYWFPVKSTRGIVKANPYGTLNVIRENGYLKIYFCPVQKLTSSLEVFAGDNLILTKSINSDVLETITDSIPLNKISGNVRITIGENKLVFSEPDEDNNLNRPNKSPEGFDKTSLYGRFVDGEQKMNFGYYNLAESAFEECLKIDPFYLPALNKLASIYYRSGKYDEALRLCEKSLSINTYDGESNYLFGLINTKTGKYTVAKGAFSIASISEKERSASYAKLSQLYILEKDWQKAHHYAIRSLDFNNRNFDALQNLMVICRYSGNIQESLKIIEELLFSLPLNHFARFEYYLLNKSSQAKSEFASMIRNELPDETYLEMARWYKSIGCNSEALDLLDLTSESPIAEYYTAFILNEQGSKEDSQKVLQKANQMTPKFIFPYKIDDLEVLKWAQKEDPSWKILYYSALIYWHLGDLEKTEILLDSCRNVDFAPFYVTRSMLKQGNNKLSDLLEAEKIEPEWRTGVALINYYLDQGDNANALLYGTKYYKKYPGNNYLGLKYAKTLIVNARYKECVEHLEKIIVLPNEGSYEGRDVYKKANLHLAMALLKEKKYTKALEAVNDSKMWLENLGVGKPFDDQIDNCLEDFITALIYDKQGKRSDANKYYEKVIAYAKSDQFTFNSNKCLIAISYDKLGNDEMVEDYMQNWLLKYPDSNVAKWCNAILNGNLEDAKKIIFTKDNNDYNFSFVVDLLQSLN